VIKVIAGKMPKTRIAIYLTTKLMTKETKKNVMRISILRDLLDFQPRVFRIKRKVLRKELSFSARL